MTANTKINETNTSLTGKGLPYDEELGLPSRLALEVHDANIQMASAYPAVSIFGGSRVKPDSKPYNDARELGRRLATMGISVITGGGPGVMEAGNRGCMEAVYSSVVPRGTSIGLNIQLPFEQLPNEYQDLSLNFKQFASRKVTFVRNSLAFIAYAGGVGTLDELFEIITLIQTQKMPRRPVILFDSQVWGPLVSFLEDTVMANGWMSKQDRKLFTMVDTIDEAIAALNIPAWPKTCDPETLKKLSIS